MLRRLFRTALTVSAYVAFGLCGALQGWVLLPLVWLCGPGPISRRQSRCQGLVGAGCAAFHRYMQLCRLFDYTPELELQQRVRAFASEPLIVVANHPTLIDTTAVLAAHSQLCCLVTPWFVKNPLLYPLLRCCGYVLIREHTWSGYAAALEAAAARLNQGQSLLIFPEGTRSPAGGLHRFKRGAFELALRHHVPILPIAVHVRGQALDGRRRWYSIPARPVKVVLEMLELVAPSDYPSGRGAAEQLAARVRNSLISVLSQPAREARAVFFGISMTELESELSQLIVEALDLSDVSPSEIDPNAPLFGDGLGLDSVDALELAIAVHKTFGVQIKAEDASQREAFQSLRKLALHIEQVRSVVKDVE